MYWTCRGDSPFDNGTISRYNTDNGTTSIVVQPEEGDTYALYVADDYIYFTDYINRQVRRCDLDGTNVTTLVSGGVYANSPAGVFATDQYIYWSNRNDGDINRAELNGDNPTILLDGDNNTNPLDVWVTDSYIYWADDAVGAEGVWRCALDGSGAERLVDTGAGEDPWGFYLTDQYIYMAIEETYSVERCDLDGGNLTTLVKGATWDDDYPIGVGVTDSHMYWTSSRAQELRRSTLAGDNITKIVSTRANPKYVRVVASEQSGRLQ